MLVVRSARIDDMSYKTILSQAINTRRRISTRTFAVCNQPPFFILFYSLLLANDRYFSSLATVARFTGNTKELGVLLLLLRRINCSVLLRSSSSCSSYARMMLIDFDNLEKNDRGALLIALYFR